MLECASHLYTKSWDGILAPQPRTTSLLSALEKSLSGFQFFCFVFVFDYSWQCWRLISSSAFRNYSRGTQDQIRLQGLPCCPTAGPSTCFHCCHVLSSPSGCHPGMENGVLNGSTSFVHGAPPLFKDLRKEIKEVLRSWEGWGMVRAGRRRGLMAWPDPVTFWITW